METPSPNQDRRRHGKPIRAEQYVRGRPVNRLRAYRQQRGLTQKELADYLNVAPQVICTAERYGRGLGEDNWYKLSVFFEVDPRVLKGYLPADFFSEKT